MPTVQNGAIWHRYCYFIESNRSCAYEKRTECKGYSKWNKIQRINYPFKRSVVAKIMLLCITIVIRIRENLTICVSCTNVRLVYLCVYIRPRRLILGAQPTSSVIYIQSDWDGTLSENLGYGWSINDPVFLLLTSSPGLHIPISNIGVIYGQERDGSSKSFSFIIIA